MMDREVSRAQSVPQTLRRLGGMFAPYWPWMILVMVLVLIVAGSQVYTAVLLGQAIDCYVNPALLSGSGTVGDAAGANCWFERVDTQGWDVPALLAGLTRLMLITTAIYIVSAASRSVSFYMMSAVGNRVVRQIRVSLFRRIHSLTLGYFNRHEAGDVMSRLTNDLDTLQQSINFMMISVLLAVVTVVWILVQMLIINYVYGLISMALIPVMYLVTNWLSGLARREFRKARREIGNINADLQENISGVREMQAFVREGASSESFREVNAANRDANISAVSYTSALSPTLEAFGFLGLTVATLAGGILLLNGGTLGGQAVTLGLVITYINLVQRLNQPIGQIAVMWTNVQSAIAGSERIFELLDEEPEIQDPPSPVAVDRLRGRVEFHHVSFHYNPDEPVLDRISLIARPGETVAIVGPTGAGKTTILNLIPRFYDPISGSVKIDGVDVRQMRRSDLRSHVGMVLQDTFLFNDTIMNNIRFSREGATDAEVRGVAELSYADEFIRRLEDGYETVLGERGSGLSQGQRQLLSITRAILADPRILILDEATSSVDTRTELLIQEALEALMRGRTSFVVAHRLSTIRNADQVLMMQNGRIVEKGTHTELLAQGGAYHALYMSQYQALEDEVPA
ncbi:MAG: ABC transporter ATP-binding protein [Caldilineaceae bacterium SB0662_bin_9]|uniref:ABC transporter ATP-binding protein n=1 Tax=Caldilineaceae bacterium SB0662_bin_9 TaxID=2605258 RepID=A0A6B1DRM2_9CHLR|nr:ABC transporter ATP-binding protein [Caldilineaceae bacterium SB0662_bin_9]